MKLLYEVSDIGGVTIIDPAPDEWSRRQAWPA